MSLKRIDHLNIVVSDMEASVDFYTEAFGFRKTLDLMLDEPWFEHVTGFANAKARCVFLEIDDDSPRIELLEYFVPQSVSTEAMNLNVVGLRHVALEVTNINDAVQRLRNMGVTLVSDVIEVPRTILPRGKRLVYVNGPDDVYIELNQYGE